MEEAEAAATPMWDVTPPVDQEWELRVIIWRTAEIPAMDEMEEMTDIYVVAKLDKAVQTTDVHWRCATGVGSFNWRCIFPVTIRHKSSEKERLTLQAIFLRSP